MQNLMDIMVLLPICPTVCLGSTTGLTLFQPFTPDMSPNESQDSLAVYKMLGFIATYENRFQDLLIEIAEIKCNHSLFR